MIHTIPCKLVGPDGGFLVVIAAVINGAGPYDFALDTGGRNSSIARLLAETLALPAGATGESFGFGSAVSFTHSRLDTLRLNTLELTDLPVVVADFAPFEARLGSRVDGILGHDVLGRFVLTIDYPNREVRLAEVNQPSTKNAIDRTR